MADKISSSDLLNGFVSGSVHKTSDNLGNTSKPAPKASPASSKSNSDELGTLLRDRYADINLEADLPNNMQALPLLPDMFPIYRRYCDLFNLPGADESTISIRLLAARPSGRLAPDSSPVLVGRTANRGEWVPVYIMDGLRELVNLMCKPKAAVAYPQLNDFIMQLVDNPSYGRNKLRFSNSTVVHLLLFGTLQLDEDLQQHLFAVTTSKHPILKKLIASGYITPNITAHTYITQTTLVLQERLLIALNLARQQMLVDFADQYDFDQAAKDIHQHGVNMMPTEGKTADFIQMLAQPDKLMMYKLQMCLFGKLMNK